MLFNSFQYLIFLPIVFIFYWLIFKSIKIQNLFVVIASSIFYGWWDWRFLILIYITIGLSYVTSLMIGSYPKWGGVIAGVNVIINLSILCYYKYLNFFADSLKVLFSQFGYQLDWFTLDVLLPVGISFYTFQALSYSIDVRRGSIEPTKDFIAFAAYISFFPQLVAGPIERSTQLLPQFLQRRVFDYTTAVDGMRQILWGFFKKLIIADNCAYLANQIFDGYESCNGSLLALGALFFTFQIYGDFSGYSDIAIGTAKLFGIRLMRNFNLPYFSRDIAEFWRRWHISLNKWFIDYVYIPIGGSRCGKLINMRNILIVFLLSGLWHGANWTFVVWGIYNGVLIIAYLQLGLNKKRPEIISPNKYIPSIKEIMEMFVTFSLVVIGWIIFRAESLQHAVGYFKGMIDKSLVQRPNFHNVEIGSTQLVYTLIFICVLQVVEWVFRKRGFGFDLSQCPSRVLRWAVYLSIIVLLTVFSGEQEKFIYFQF